MEVSPPSSDSEKGAAANFPPTPPRTPKPPTVHMARLPYAPMRKPMPLREYRLYPNYTPTSPPHTLDPDATCFSPDDNRSTPPYISDRRPLHEETEDDLSGRLWGGASPADLPVLDGNGLAQPRMAEWNPQTQQRERWVGPMVIFAQLHPSERTDPHPPGVDPAVPVEGPDVDLGPKGMYASLGFEDLERLLPWVELKAGGGHSGEGRRAGLGFDDATFML